MVNITEMIPTVSTPLFIFEKAKTQPSTAIVANNSQSFPSNREALTDKPTVIVKNGRKMAINIMIEATIARSLVFALGLNIGCGGGA